MSLFLYGSFLEHSCGHSHMRMGGQLHTECVLAVDDCPALDLFAATSFDEDIIVWNVETPLASAASKIHYVFLSERDAK